MKSQSSFMVLTGKKLSKMSYFMNWVKYFCSRMKSLESNILTSILGIQKLQKKLWCQSYFKTARAKPTCPSWCNKPPWWRVEEGRWGQRSQCCTWEVHSLDFSTFFLNIIVSNIQLRLLIVMIDEKKLIL